MPTSHKLTFVRPLPYHRATTAKADLWIAQDAAGVPVAAKVARASHARLGIKEANRLAELAHPNVVPVLTRGRTPEGRPYFAMPLLPGSLNDWSERPVTSEGIARALRDVLTGLEHLHQHGYAHGDVSLGNILRGPEGYVLADFESLHRLWDANASPRRRATIETAAPEILHGRVRAPTIGTDLYSVGVVAHDLLACGRPIIRDEDTPEQDGERAAAKRKPPAWPRFAHWQDFLDRALEPDPKDRFRTAAEMLAALPQ